MMTKHSTTALVAYVPMPDKMRESIEMMLGWTMWISIGIMVMLLMFIGGLWWMESYSKTLPFGMPAQERLVKVLWAGVLLATAPATASAIILTR